VEKFEMSTTTEAKPAAPVIEKIKVKVTAAKSPC